MQIIIAITFVLIGVFILMVLEFALLSFMEKHNFPGLLRVTIGIILFYILIIGLVFLNDATGFMNKPLSFKF